MEYTPPQTVDDYMTSATAEDKTFKTPEHKYRASRSHAFKELKQALGERGCAPPRSLPDTLYQATEKITKDGIAIEKNEHLVRQLVKDVSDIRKLLDAIYAHLLPDMASASAVAQSDAPESSEASSDIGVLNIPKDTSTLIGGYLPYNPYPLAFPENVGTPASFNFRRGWNGSSFTGKGGPDTQGKHNSHGGPRFDGPSHMSFH
ncbi:hypothetical protein SISNIDRAFT_491555 [Sistotremastrum niveocremeum HHB9708]|uniref:Uncharacterized protein n=1 Tax=Sistotremastrum niveocremeum HHB9708 TaxID=1314777 RepID=A0A164MND0_9AGAM|nr:hypothetical protein SISNIDRAFT_491555 [Sistotremastrum niveocremeum HHB9708]